MPRVRRLVRAAGIEPDTSCLEDRHAAHYATPAGMSHRNEGLAESTGIEPVHPEGFDVSTALPCRSANSPVQVVMARSTGLEPARGRLEHG